MGWGGGWGHHIKIFQSSKHAVYLAFIPRGRNKGESAEREDKRETHAYSRQTKERDRKWGEMGVE